MQSRYTKIKCTSTGDSTYQTEKPKARFGRRVWNFSAMSLIFWDRKVTNKLSFVYSKVMLFATPVISSLWSWILLKTIRLIYAEIGIEVVLICTISFDLPSWLAQWKYLNSELESSMTSTTWYMSPSSSSCSIAANVERNVYFTSELSYWKFKFQNFG